MTFLSTPEPLPISDDDRARLLAGATYEGLFVVHGGRVVAANNQGAEMFGYAVDELPGMEVLALIASGNRPRIAARFANNEIDTEEGLGLRKDGTTFPIEARTRLVEVGRRTLRVSALRDITDRRQVEDALRQSEERHRALASCTFEAIAFSQAGRIVDANVVWSTLFDYPPEQVKGMHLSEFAAPEDRARVVEKLKQPVTQAEEFVGMRSDGQRLVVEVRARQLELQGRELRVSIVRDITARKRVEETLRESDRRKDEFLAILSHELRNPLMAISSGVWVAEHTAADSDAARKARAVVGREVTQLARIVDDLLDVTRITRGKIQLQTERIRLGDVVARAVEAHKTAFPECGLTFDIDVAREALWVEGDPVRLAQVVANLLHNATKFTPRGGRVSVVVGRDGEAAFVRVEDSGCGIAPEVIGRIFEPFAQAEQPIDRRMGGLGLGLALVKGLVELHGGTVTAASAGSGKGATFDVRVPCAEAPQPTEQTRAPDRGTATRKPAAQRRVLLIEDDPDTVAILRDAVEMMGHDVRVAFDGTTGISAAREFQPDIVLCDIGIPGMSGFDVAPVFKADEELRKARLVALTGYARPEDRRKAALAGFDDLLAKPVLLDEIERVIAESPERAR